jgi:hypothetical protein
MMGQPRGQLCSALVVVGPGGDGRKEALVSICKLNGYAAGGIGFGARFTTFPRAAPGLAPQVRMSAAGSLRYGVRRVCQPAEYRRQRSGGLPACDVVFQAPDEPRPPWALGKAPLLEPHFDPRRQL